MKRLLEEALVALECENSLWKARRMPDFGRSLTRQRRLGGRLGVPKNAVLPTVIVKEEDRAPLTSWQTTTNIPIHVWQVFYDVAYGLSLVATEKLLSDGLVGPKDQIFQAPGGATTTKITYFFPYFHAYEVGQTIEEPTLKAASIEDANGHILPYVCFEGGKLRLTERVISLLAERQKQREQQ